MTYVSYILVFSCINIAINMLPTAINNMFTTNADNHNYNTRHAFDFEYTNNKPEFGNRSICYQGVKIWNNIQNQVKNSKNLNSSNVLIKIL